MSVSKARDLIGWIDHVIKTTQLTGIQCNIENISLCVVYHCPQAMSTGCTPISPETLQKIQPKTDGGKPLCMVESGKDGMFAFPSVPSGDYVLVRHWYLMINLNLSCISLSMLCIFIFYLLLIIIVYHVQCFVGSILSRTAHYLWCCTNKIDF